MTEGAALALRVGQWVADRAGLVSPVVVVEDPGDGRGVVVVLLSVGLRAPRSACELAGPIAGPGM